jgi:hypothetical protein
VISRWCSSEVHTCLLASATVSLMNLSIHLRGLAWPPPAACLAPSPSLLLQTESLSYTIWSAVGFNTFVHGKNVSGPVSTGMCMWNVCTGMCAALHVGQ